MSIGKLYKSNDEQFEANVDYQLFDKSPTKLWGELILDNYRPVDDGGGYVIELEDNHKCQCNLKRRINRAVSGIPPRYVYYFSGNIFASPSPPMT